MLSYVMLVYEFFFRFAFDCLCSDSSTEKEKMKDGPVVLFAVYCCVARHFVRFMFLSVHTSMFLAKKTNSLPYTELNDRSPKTPCLPHCLQPPCFTASFFSDPFKGLTHTQLQRTEPGMKYARRRNMQQKKERTFVCFYVSDLSSRSNCNHELSGSGGREWRKEIR